MRLREPATIEPFEFVKEFMPIMETTVVSSEILVSALTLHDFNLVDRFIPA